MELNLRKARKLEAKIAKALSSDALQSALKVRVQADAAERQRDMAAAREQLINQVNTRNTLCSARFAIRKAISDANHAVGISSLMNEREYLTAQLALSAASVDSLNVEEMEDLIQVKRNRFERGDSNGYNDAVTATFTVARSEDVAKWKYKDEEIRRRLEDLEDQLSQKNLGAKITLPSETVKLLNSAGLL